MSCKCIAIRLISIKYDYIFASSFRSGWRRFFFVATGKFAKLNNKHKLNQMKDLLAIIQNVGPGANLKIEVDSRDMMAFADALVEKAMAELKTQAVATPPAEDVLVPKKEAREILDVCDATLWKWDRLGYLVPVKVGRKIFYWKSHIDKLMGKY